MKILFAPKDQEGNLHEHKTTLHNFEKGGNERKRMNEKLWKNKTIISILKI